MLSIGTMSAGQENYYTDLAREDYYLEGGEPQGQWLGKGAHQLGLAGPVEADALSAVFRGYMPNGDRLVKNAGAENRQAGWDLTFSVPKSVSVVWSQGNQTVRKEIQAVVEEAVAKTIDYLDKEATFSRVGKGGCDRVHSHLVAAAFPHGTSRALDPQYHVHCLVLNVGVTEDGRTRTIVSRPLYEHKMVAGVFFRAELAAALQRRLGLAVERPLDGKGQPKSWFEVKGVPEKLVKFFSKRREAIEKVLGAKGLESAAAAAFATLDTREARPEIPARETLFQEWREEGKAHGFDQRAVDRLLRERRSVDRVKEYQAALNEALQRITYSKSHFSEKDLLRHTLEAAQGRGLEAPFVRDWVGHDLANDDRLVNLGQRNGQTRYTTSELLAVERELLEAVEDLEKTKFKGLSKRTVKNVIKKEWSSEPETKKTPIGKALKAMRDKGTTFRLNEEQAAAVRDVTQSGGRIKVVSGIAGTGKTTMLRATREAFEREGYKVVGCALAGVAAKRLEEGSGIKSDTVRMRLLQLYPKPWDLAKHHVRQLTRAALGKKTWKPERLTINRKTVLIIDEAGMVGTRDFALLTAAVKKGGGMLVCVGDKAQLPSIEAGGAFGSIMGRVDGTHLEKVTRQRWPNEREAVKRLSRGEAEAVLKEYAAFGYLHVADDRQAARETLVEHWKREGGVKNPQKHVIFVSTNQEVDEYNDLVQQTRIDAGEVDASRALTVGQETLYPGDRVMFLKKSRPLGVENGDVGTVVAIRDGRTGSSLTVKVDGATNAMEIPVSQTPGDGYEGLRRAYAFTTHKLQGATVDHAYIHLGGAMTDQEMTYVKCSRHRESIYLYTDQTEAGVSLTNLARENAGGGRPIKADPGQDPDYSPLLSQARRSNQEELAHDILEENRPEPPLEIQIEP